MIVVFCALLELSGRHAAAFARWRLATRTSKRFTVRMCRFSAKSWAVSFEQCKGSRVEQTASAEEVCALWQDVAALGTFAEVVVGLIKERVAVSKEGLIASVVDLCAREAHTFFFRCGQRRHAQTAQSPKQDDQRPDMHESRCRGPSVTTHNGDYHGSTLATRCAFKRSTEKASDQRGCEGQPGCKGGRDKFSYADL